MASANANTSRVQPFALDIGERKKPSAERGPKLSTQMRQLTSTIASGVRQPAGFAARDRSAREGLDILECVYDDSSDAASIRTAAAAPKTAADKARIRCAHGRAAPEGGWRGAPRSAIWDLLELRITEPIPKVLNLR